jgi:hypothetical protein
VYPLIGDLGGAELVIVLFWILVIAGAVWLVRAFRKPRSK